MSRKILLLATYAFASSCAPTRVRPASDAQPEVVVSRRAVHVSFPIDHSGPVTIARNDRSGTTMVWGIQVPLTPGPTSVLALSWPDDTTSSRDSVGFTSLNRTIRQATVMVCQPGGPLQPCSHPKSAIRISGDRIVIALSDSATIDRLFCLRPPHVDATWRAPGDSARHTARIAVLYVNPYFAAPDSVTKARQYAAIEAFERESRWVERTIAMRHDLRRDTVFVQVGDSTRIEVAQSVGQYDSGMSNTLIHDGWSIGDSSVAAIRKSPPLPEPPPGALRYTSFSMESPYWLIAKSPGRTILRAFDIPAYMGPAPASTPPTSLMKEIRVIPRIGSLRIFAARDTVESSMPAQVRVEIRDRTGAVIPGVAVLVRTSYTMQAMADSGAALLRGPGTHYVVAEFWDLRDSVLVTQLPPKGKRP